MRLKERESGTPIVFFKSVSSWQKVPLELAEGEFQEIDFNNFDREDIFRIWSASKGKGRGMSSAWVAAIFGKKVEEIRELPSGSYIFPNGEIVSPEEE